MYFDEVTTIEELKKEYRRLCMKHHPDKGGNTETMQAINSMYEARLTMLAQSEKNTEEAINIGKQYQEQIQKIIHLPDIEIEVCGLWIWVSGQTFPVKTQLNEANYKFASKKKVWYWKPPNMKSTNRKPRSMEWIRNRYGSERVETEAPTPIG